LISGIDWKVRCLGWRVLFGLKFLGELKSIEEKDSEVEFVGS